MADLDARMVVLEGVARQAKGARPTQKWRQSWRAAIAPFSPEEVRAWCRQAMAEAAEDALDEGTALAAYWGLADVAAHGVPALLADAALKRVRDEHTRLAGAAVTGLGLIAAEGEREIANEAIHQLQRLKGRLRHRTLLKRVQQALSEVATARALSPEALQDLVVETGELSRDGSRVWQAGPYDLYLFLSDDGEIELAIFERKSGKALGSPPKALRQDHFAVLSEARAVQKVLAETVTTQKQRLEQALESQRAWSWQAWREVFEHHPIMRHLAKRLVWSVEVEGAMIDTALLTGDELIDRGGDTVLPVEAALLRLAHPVLLAPEVLRGWQHGIVSRRLVQPFKQVFREYYRPSAEDLEIGRYTDRFAGQVVRHRQMYALLRARGWGGLAGIGPAGYQGTKVLAEYGLQAVVGFRQFRHYQEPQRRQVVLEQIEFYPHPVPEWRPGVELRVPVAEVPPVAFSEVMRDVALVVGVAGLGSEARLRGEAPDEAHARAHLLSGIAEMRAGLLRELMPSLGLAPQVRLEGHDALVSARGHVFRLNLATGEVTLDGEGRRIELEGFERGDAPLYLPYEGADSATAAVLSTLLWLVQFGR